MPLVRIDLSRGKSAEYKRTIGDVIYDAMTAALNVPQDDRFQIFGEHPSEDLSIDPSYLGIERSKDCILIQVTLNEGRTLDQKRTFYKAIADGLFLRLGLRREDVFVNLVEVKKENWSLATAKLNMPHSGARCVMSALFSARSSA